MKGMVFLNTSNNLIFKSKEFLEEVHPEFVSLNYALINKAWRIDSEDDALMLDFLKALSHLAQYKQVHPEEIKNLMKTINYDYNGLAQRLNETRLQSRQNPSSDTTSDAV